MSHRVAALTITAAAAADTALGLAYAAAEHIPVADGLYWAVTTATTVGYGDLTPRTPAGHAIAVVVMLTVVPLFAAAFSLFTSGLAAGHVRRHLGGAERRIAEEADRRHVIMQRHVERLLTGHCADLKEHVAAVAGPQVRAGAGSSPAQSGGLPAETAAAAPPAAAAERVVPPAATPPPAGRSPKTRGPRRM